MASTSVSGQTLHLPAEALQASFDRVPVAFTHELHRLPQFARAALERLAASYAGQRGDYFVAGSAAAPGTPFYGVPTVETTAAEAMARVDVAPTRLLLKRPEWFDIAFRALLDQMFEEVAATGIGVRRENLVRLEGGILITSAASTTPFHFDPESNFFSQVEGEKTYHLYEPDALSEAEKEPFFRRAKVDIGQVALAGRDPAKEHVFHLKPGLGFHQPHSAPHWVQTVASRSVSYTMVFETRESRLRSRARGFNHYLRQAGLTPSAPGARPALDRAKGRTMVVVAKAQRAVARARAGLAG